MANFYFPQAFSANPIQSFIDGKIAAQDRARKERDRQIELFYKYQDFRLRKARHDASMARLGAQTKLLERRAAEARLGKASNPFARGLSGRGIAARNTGAAYDVGARDIQTRPSIYEAARRDAFSTAFDGQGFGQDSFSNNSFDSSSLGGNPFARPDYSQDPIGVPQVRPETGLDEADGYPTPMSFEEAEKAYGSGFSDDVAPKRSRDPYSGTRKPVGRAPSYANPFDRYDDYDDYDAAGFFRPARGY